MKNKKILIVIVIIFIIVIIFYNIVKNVISKDSNTLNNEEMYQQNLKGYGFYINGMPEETMQIVKSLEGFEEKLKEFAYKNQIIDYGEVSLTYVTEKKEGNMITIKFEVKSYMPININAEINLNDNTFEFYMYR